MSMDCIDLCRSLGNISGLILGNKIFIVGMTGKLERCINKDFGFKGLDVQGFGG